MRHNFYEKIRAIMREENLSIAQLSRAASIEYHALLKPVHNKVQPDYKKIRKIVRRYPKYSLLILGVSTSIKQKTIYQE